MSILYTSQSEIVLHTLKTEDYTVKKEYITKKYGEDIAKIMLNAYDWFSKEMEKQIPKPKNSQYPIWLFHDIKYVTLGEGQHLITLEIPDDKHIVFDNHGWERVLSMSYVGKSEKEEYDYDKKLQTIGINVNSDIFFKPYYPIQKREIISSWKNIFYTTEKSIKRSAAWEIKKEWIRSIK